MSLRLAIVLIAIVSLLIAVVFVFAAIELRTGSEKSTDSAVTQPVEPVEQEPVELGPNEKRILMSQLGMTCSSCRAAVASALGKVEGVKNYSIDTEKDQVIVTYKDDQTSPDAIKEAIIKGGYEVGGIKELD